MSRLFMFLCLTFSLVVFTGCGGDKEDQKEDQKVKNMDKKNGPGSGSKDDGKGSGKKEKTPETKKEEKTPEVKKEEKAPEKKEEKAPETKKEEKAPEVKKDNASVEKATDFQLVSVKLPNMTCEVCEQSVQSALTSDAGFIDLKTNVKGQTATFKVNKGVDLKAKLDQIASANGHVADYEIE